MIWLGITIGLVLGAIAATGAYVAAPELLAEIREAVQRRLE